MFVRILAEALVQHGFDVSIITSNARTPRYWYDPIFGRKLDRQFEIIHGVSVYRFATFQLLSSIAYILVHIVRFLPRRIDDRLKILANGPYLLGLETFLKHKHFDVIHSSPFPLGINLQATSGVQKCSPASKFIITPFFHAHMSEFYNPELQPIYRASDRIHVISQSEKADVMKGFDVDPKKFCILPLCLNTISMHSNEDLLPDIARIKSAYGLEHRKVILFAGIKGKGKGVMDALSAVYTLWKKDPSYVFVAMGTATPEWQTYIKNVDPDCLRDLPYKTGREKEAFFALADIYCMPSATETFGLTYAEAWHKKKPVIGADFPPVNELIIKNAGGITVPYGNTQAIAAAITKLIRNPVLSRKLGANGYRALMARYTLDGMLPKYIRLFQESENHDR